MSRSTSLKSQEKKHGQRGFLFSQTFDFSNAPSFCCEGYYGIELKDYAKCKQIIRMCKELEQESIKSMRYRMVRLVTVEEMNAKLEDLRIEKAKAEAENQTRKKKRLTRFEEPKQTSQEEIEQPKQENDEVFSPGSIDSSLPIGSSRPVMRGNEVFRRFEYLVQKKGRIYEIVTDHSTKGLFFQENTEIAAQEQDKEETPSKLLMFNKRSFENMRWVVSRSKCLPADIKIFGLFEWSDYENAFNAELKWDDVPKIENSQGTNKQEGLQIFSSSAVYLP